MIIVQPRQLIPQNLTWIVSYYISTKRIESIRTKSPRYTYLFFSPTSNATKNRLTQLYAAAVAVISTTSRSLKNPLSSWNTSSGTLTVFVMASVYFITAH